MFFDILNKNNIFSKISKAYVEGIYNDSPLNRKLGRVGMSYAEYAKMVDKKKEEEKHKEKKEKNEIPINISDLTFKDQDGKKIAEYEVKGAKIKIEIISSVKHQDRKYNLKIEGKEGSSLIEDINTTQLLREMRKIKDGNISENSDIPLYDKLPLTADELDKKWGDTGFVHTYYKDDLDIKVWIREDSDPKNPRLNIYIVDTKSKKKKSFTNLSLSEVHNELLKYELNPSLDKPLTKEQLKELKRLQLEKNLISKEDIEKENKEQKRKEEIEDLKRDSKYLVENGLGEVKTSTSKGIKTTKFVSFNYKTVSIGDYKVSIHGGLYDQKDKGTYSLEIKKDNGQEKYYKGKSLKEINDLVKDLVDNKDNYDMFGGDGILPSKNVGIIFDARGVAFFNNGESIAAFKVNPNDRDKIDVVISNKDGVVQGVDTFNVDNFQNNIEEYDIDINPKNQVVYRDAETKANQEVPLKNLIVNYSSIADFFSPILRNEVFYNPKFLVTKEDIQKFEQDLSRKKLIENKWNKGKRELYTFVKSGKFRDWLDEMPNPKTGTKADIYNEFANFALYRLSPYGNKYDIGYDVFSVQKNIIEKYYKTESDKKEKIFYY